MGAGAPVKAGVGVGAPVGVAIGVAVIAGNTTSTLMPLDICSENEADTVPKALNRRIPAAASSVRRYCLPSPDELTDALPAASPSPAVRRIPRAIAWTSTATKGHRSRRAEGEPRLAGSARPAKCLSLDADPPMHEYSSRRHW